MPASPAPLPCAQRSTAEKTGEGQLVSTSAREGLYTISFDLSVLLGWGLTLQIGQRESMGNVAMNNYSASDGKRFWVVGLDGMRHWPRARRWGEDWLDDERYADPRNRARNAAEIIAQLDEIFATKTMAEWEEVFATEPDFSGHRSTAPTTCSPTRSSMHPARSSKCPTARAPRT